MDRKCVMSWLKSLKHSIEDMIPDFDEIEGELDYIEDNIDFMTTHFNQFCDAIFSPVSAVEEESGSENVEICLPNEEDVFAALAAEEKNLMNSVVFETDDDVKVEEAEEDESQFDSETALLQVDGAEDDDHFNGGFADSSLSNFSQDIPRHLEQLLHNTHSQVMDYFESEYDSDVSDYYTEEFDGCDDDDLSEYNTDEGDFSDDDDNDCEIVSRYDVDELPLQLDKSQGIASMADELPIQSDKSKGKASIVYSWLGNGVSLVENHYGSSDSYAIRDSVLNFVDEDCVMFEEDDYVLVE